MMRAFALASLAVLLLAGCAAPTTPGPESAPNEAEPVPPGPHDLCTNWWSRTTDRSVYVRAKEDPPFGSMLAQPLITPLPFSNARLDAAWGPGNYSLVQALWSFPEDVANATR